MSNHDTVGNLLNSLIMGHRTHKVAVTQVKSQYTLQILDILVQEGYILSFREEGKYRVRVFLKYDNGGAPVLKGIKRLSLPSRRRYAKYSELRKIGNRAFTLLVSTPAGVVTAKEALLQKVGGELIFLVF